MVRHKSVNSLEENFPNLGHFFLADKNSKLQENFNVTSRSQGYDVFSINVAGTRKNKMSDTSDHLFLRVPKNKTAPNFQRKKKSSNPYSLFQNFIPF